MFNVFITGLNKGCGKTIVTAGLASTMQSLGYSTSIYKPIQLGATNLGGFKKSPDVEIIKYFDQNINTKTTYLFTSKNSPFVSCYEDNLKIEMDTIYTDYAKFSTFYDFNFVEGSNSISTPIITNYTEASLISKLQIPCILVVNPKTTNLDTLILGLEFIAKNNIRLLGIIFNAIDDNSENLEEKYYREIISKFENINILGSIPYYEDIKYLKPESIISDILTNFDLEKLFNMKIAKLN